jgi:7-cyano-7-deazaguanine tRNA-ribosyltransferase
VSQAKPDWWPIPRDYIPTPRMTIEEQRGRLRQTMDVNLAYSRDGYVPVIHVSQLIDEYIAEVRSHDGLLAKPAIAVGGLVPQLLRAVQARPYQEILDNVFQVRRTFGGKKLHLFGIGGTATLHLAALVGVDSVDSTGWRNRAARGIVQLPGSGDRSVADLGKWRGRPPNPAEWETLRSCSCPACQSDGLDGLKSDGIAGFCHRATHNLWTLLEEARWIEDQLAAGTYAEQYRKRLDNSIYLPLVEKAVKLRLRWTKPGDAGGTRPSPADPPVSPG